VRLYNCASSLTPSEKLRKRLRRLVRLPPKRRKPRQRKAFANHEAEFLWRLEEKERRTRQISRSPAFGASPGKAPGVLPAVPAIFFSAARDATFRDEGKAWSEFMPRRTVHYRRDARGHR